MKKHSRALASVLSAFILFCFFSPVSTLAQAIAEGQGDGPADAPGAPVSRYIYQTEGGLLGSGISVFRSVPQLGRLVFNSFIERPPGSQNGPFDPVVDPLGRFLFELEGYENLNVWSINPHSGHLTLDSTNFTAFLNGGIAVHPSGQFVYVNDTYTDQGAIYGFSVSPTGMLTLVTTVQLGLFSGSLVMHPSGKFLYVVGPDNNQNQVQFIFNVDSTTGALTSVVGSPFPGIGTVFGFDPTGRYAFAYPLTGSQGINVYKVNQNTGTLHLVSGSPFPSLSYGGLVGPTGQYFYQNSAGGLLQVFSINAGTGILTPIPGSPFPLGNDFMVGIDPSNMFAYFVDFYGNRNDTYRIEPSTGAVTTLLDSTPGNGGPSQIAIFSGPTPVQDLPKFAYVADLDSNDISGYAINGHSGVLTPIPGSPFATGQAPSSLATNYFSHFAYSVNSASNTVSGFVSGSAGSLTSVPGSPFPVGKGASAGVMNPNGTFLYVSNSADNTISTFAINLHTGSLKAKAAKAVSGSSPGPLITDPAGNVLFVGNEKSKSISTYYIDPSFGTLSEATSQGSPTSIGFSPSSFAVDPTGLYFYATDAASGTVHAFAINFTASTPVLQPISGISSFSVGASPDALSVDPVGRFLYAANRGSNNISAFTIDLKTGGLTAIAGSPFPVGSSPSSANVDASGKFLLVSNAESNNVSVLAIGVGGGLTQITGSPFAAGTGPSSVGSEGTQR